MYIIWHRVEVQRIEETDVHHMVCVRTMFYMMPNQIHLKILIQAMIDALDITTSEVTSIMH
jgi:hypothetical protein